MWLRCLVKKKKKKITEMQRAPLRRKLGSAVLDLKFPGNRYCASVLCIPSIQHTHGPSVRYEMPSQHPSGDYRKLLINIKCWAWNK